MFSKIHQTRQASINSICRYFVFFKIHSTKDLSLHLTKILHEINKNINIFSPMDTVPQRMAIFKAAIAAYASVTEYNIKVPENINSDLFNFKESKDTISVEDRKIISKTDHATRDLSKVVRSYDQMVAAKQLIKRASKKITKILQRKSYDTCDSIILGAGDTGTTLWLEKYKSHHHSTYKTLSENKLSNILMISDGFGGWSHDYTLAQTHSSLERIAANKNPSDFIPTQWYSENPQVNARHVFQANVVCLGKTQAPIFTTNVLSIEKRENHSSWENSTYAYRLIVQIPEDEKRVIYTNNIDICSGMGEANTTFDEKVILAEEAKRLTEFDSELGFTPIVHGNQYVLTGTEEATNNRTILIYGGGGTASACYRKSFFGTDIRTYNRQFSPENQKNKVFWVFRDYIGTGKLATIALEKAKERKEVFQGELIKITPTRNKKLILEFKMHNSSSTKNQKILCDQLVYSIGQENTRMKQVCQELDSNLQFQSDASGMLLYVSTSDNKVNFFGAAAMIFAKKEFIKQTTEWLDSQNIGGDVGAGSMPPTRAQVKRYLFLQGSKPKNINVNMDTTCLIKEFFLDAKVDKTVASAFIDDLLLARKHDTYGCSRDTLKKLLKQYQLDKVFDICGHSHLALKKDPWSINERQVRRAKL